MVGLATAQPSNTTEPGLTPDNPLYVFEQLSESLELKVAQAPFIGSPELEAKVRANHAAERLSEAREMSRKNKTKYVDELMEKYNRNMNSSFETAEKINDSGLSKRLENVSNDQINTLKQIEKRVPKEARKGIEEALENNRKRDSLNGKPGKGPDNRNKDSDWSSENPQNKKESLDSPKNLQDKPASQEDSKNSETREDPENRGETTELGKNSQNSSGGDGKSLETDSGSKGSRP